MIAAIESRFCRALTLGDVHWSVALEPLQLDFYTWVRDLVVRRQLDDIITIERLPTNIQATSRTD